jgi:hypothetical protein
MEAFINKVNLFFLCFSIFSIDTKTMEDPKKYVTQINIILFLAQNAKFSDGMIPPQDTYKTITGQSPINKLSKKGFNIRTANSISWLKFKRFIQRLKLKKNVNNNIKKPEYPILLTKKNSNPNIFFDDKEYIKDENRPSRKRSFSGKN